MFLPEIVVHVPGKILARLEGYASELIFEIVEWLRLLRSIRDPIVQRDARRERIAGSRAHVIEGQKVEPIRTRV